MHDHDIDGRLPEMEVYDLEAEEFEFPEEVEELVDTEADSPFTEAEVLDLASDFLEVRDEAELDQFFGKAFSFLKRKVPGALRSGLGKQLVGQLKSQARRFLPMGANLLGGLVGGPAGAALAGQAAQAAGNVLGLELEGYSPEDQEFEVARRFVELVGEAAQQAALTPPGVDPQAAATAALVEAARMRAPGLLRRRARRRPPAGRGQCQSGVWKRSPNGAIILYGV
jgi:hypothetical protein